MRRKYKIKYKFKSPNGCEYTLYKYYTRTQTGIKGFLATLSVAIAIAILVPSPDEFVTIPAIAKLIQILISVNSEKALIYGFFLYKGIGIFFLILAAIFGTQYLKKALMRKISDVDFTIEKTKKILKFRRF